MKIEVNGSEYEVPIYNPDIKYDFYLIKKALNGDKEAREFLLAEESVRNIFIGDGQKVRWLILRKDSEQVIEY